MVDITLVIPIAGAVGLAFAGYLTWYVFRKDQGSPEMQEIGNAIRSGANAYMKRQYTTIIIISLILAVLIAVLIDPKPWVGLSFFVGAGASAVSGYIGMYVSVRSNIRTAAAARRSLNEALVISFRGGAVSGMGVVALSLIGVAGIFYTFNSAMGFEIAASLDAAIGFAFGASFAALFAQLGGGIYTKAADVGADLVGKIEAGIPEDDPRNPAVIADLVGDNVGDCAGRGADLFESTAAENIGAMVLGLSLYTFWTAIVPESMRWSPGDALVWIFFPLVARSFGIFASLAGVLAVRLTREDKDPMSGINMGYYLTCVLAAVFFFFATRAMFGDEWLYFFGAGLIGIALSIVIVYITQYYTSGSWRPVREIAQASTTGPATNIITGLSIAMETTALPVISIIVALLAAFGLGQMAAPDVLDGTTIADAATYRLIYGFYGTAVATMGMLATCAFILATDTFGPITDNAGGIIEMSKQPEDIRRRTDRLDACGNTTKALTKGYAMASAALAAFLLFGAYFERVYLKLHAKDPTVTLSSVFQVDIAKPEVFVGGLLGAMLVFLFASLAIRAVGKAAHAMINEVRRQFKADPGIMLNTSKPDYAKCVDIATKGALKAMVLPALLPVLVPVGFGVLMAALQYDTPYESVGALLMIGTITGIMVANMFNNGGGAWDNGKKYIEAGEYGGKKSPAHAAAVVGDTVGDPLKDTAGPSIHVLVKLLSTVTLVFVGLFIAL
jgi:K(+)-stimulated pyrophosphate-energized sodium pump